VALRRGHPTHEGTDCVREVSDGEYVQREQRRVKRSGLIGIEDEILNNQAAVGSESLAGAARTILRSLLKN